MQQGDYSSYYQFPHNPPNPNPNPTDPQLPYASAPPFASGYASSDYSPYQSNYPLYPRNSDPVHPTAPSYAPQSSTTPPITNPSSLSSFCQPPPPPNPTSAPSFSPYDSHGAYQPPTAQPPYFPSYASPPPQPEANPHPSYYSSSHFPVGSSMLPVPHLQDNGGYFDDGAYGRTRYVSGCNLSGKRSESYSGYGGDGYGDSVYAYLGGKVEPYGARGTAPKASSSAMFDDYGRPISLSSGKDSSYGSVVSSPKIVRAVPKADAQQDAKSGVQKFRVKLLPESGGQSTMDVLCQIGLDGIRMLDPSTSRTLRIYPLETVTRCDVTDSSTLAFWSKSSVDIEPRRIRLQSNSYTTNTLLDTITAATVQIKEMGGGIRPSESVKTAEQPAERKKGLGDWMNLIKPANEEKDHWVPDEAVSKCTSCGTDFGAFVRRHHCRNCGDIFCGKCTQGRTALTADENAQPVRVCDRCMAEVTHRLSNAKEAASKPAVQSHEDLAKKLQEEMERNRRASSSGSKSDGSGRRMKDVACPTCTVHLQVQVPTSGSETIECGVCQHPFLVSAH